MSGNLGQYFGRLDAAEIAAGINVARRNARSLASEARILLDAGCFARAASLAILSIEESGKSSILRMLALAENDVDAKKAWKQYRSHTKKNALWLMPQLVASGAKKLEDFRPLFAEGAEHPSLLDDVKQIGFYSDCLADRHWYEPSEVIDDALAQEMIAIAGMFLSEKEVSAIEIELWIEHMGPIQRRSTRWSKVALVQWADAMKEAGLQVGDMRAFVDIDHP